MRRLVTTRHYDLFGLSFSSEFIIPWAAESTGERVADVFLRRAPAGGAEPPAQSHLFQFEVPTVGSYRIGDGREIVVRAEAGASEDELRLYLLGSALGVLLHQRGLLVLHANAIVIEGGAILFMGRSGAGKSTLAAWFASRGFAVLTDDVCALDVAGTGGVMVLPGLQRLRLTGEAAARFGFETGDASLCSSSGKHEIGLPQMGTPQRHALRACYLLSDGAEAGEMLPLASLDAVEMLMSNTYRGFALQELGGSALHMAACLRVANAVPCFEARRDKDWERFDATAEALLAHARTDRSLAPRCSETRC